MPSKVLLNELINFQPKQNEALNQLLSPQCKYLLYGGAAGGGKSYFLRWAALWLGLYYLSKGIRNVPIGLFSEDYPTLKDRQIARIKREFPEWLGRLVESRDEGYIFEASERYGGFRILLRNLDDPSKYMSAEFAAVLVEELTRNPLETFEDLRFRLRYPGIDDVKFVGTTNPGGIGHAWVKRLWIEPDPNEPDKEKDRFFFVPAYATDNKYIGKEYITQLESMPEQKRKAWLEGSWDIFEGQFFSEFSRQRHIVEPFKIPSGWKRYIGMDWGVNKPFAVIWMAEDFDSNMYIYRELYYNGEQFEAKFGKPLTPKRLKRIIQGIMDKANEDYVYCVADPSMWNNAYFGKGAKAIEQGESIAEAMSMNSGLKMLKGDNDRQNGWSRFREALASSPSGHPYLRFFKTCYHSIRTVPALVYDKHKVEDVDTDGEDHVGDAIRYILMSRPTAPVHPKPKEVNLIKKQLAIARRRHEQSEKSYYD